MDRRQFTKILGGAVTSMLIGVDAVAGVALPDPPVLVYSGEKLVGVAVEPPYSYFKIGAHVKVPSVIIDDLEFMTEYVVKRLRENIDLVPQSEVGRPIGECKIRIGRDADDFVKDMHTVVAIQKFEKI